MPLREQNSSTHISGNSEPMLYSYFLRAGEVLDSPGVKTLKLDPCCETCATTKATKVAVSLPLRDKSVNYCQYILNIQDLALGLVSAIPLKSWGCATDEVIWWIVQFMTISKWAVRRLKTENALEFVVSKALSEYLSRMGIIHEKSAPHEHHKNSAVEQTNRTLTDISRALIHSRALPLNLWLYVFCQAAYIFNRILHQGKDITPIERVLGRCGNPVIYLEIHQSTLWTQVTIKNINARSHSEDLTQGGM
ncbi:uncharacterized protein VP01_187g5 [Puccinia sorghi]|uniref:Integrase catalytic domain-containing protein n=1 Tax=Puccinia sorghi TaxID=27349 RepID=A0A0L6VDL7_9BASI|nr:uncharacterized protein VP01_187g5 [Puccinia sorghi]